MRIQTRIIGAAMLVVAVVSLFYAVYFVGKERRAAREQLNTTVTNNETLLKVVTAGPLYDGNVEQLDAILDSLFTDPDITRIELKEYQGNIRMYRTRTPATPQGVTIVNKVVIKRSINELGEITTEYSTARIEQRLLQSRNNIFLFSIVLVLGLSGVIFFVARGLTRPMERLTEAARDMASGHLDREIAASGAAELQSLGQSFIRLRNAIREKMADLAAQNEALQLKDRAIASSVNGIAIADPNGLITYVNPSFLRVWGYDDISEVLGRPAVDFLQDPEEAARIIETLRAGGGFTGELAGRRHDGSFFPVELSANLMTDVQGRPSYLMASFIDITERKVAEKERGQLEAQLLQAQKMESVGRLAGGVAHDFNNMLSVILGYAALMKNRLPAADPLMTSLLEIERAANRSRDLTSQLLAFSRKQVIAPKVVDLNVLIEAMQNALTRMIGEDIELRVDLAEGLWNVKIDPMQVDQIIMNLAVNARDAMPNGGTLTIETANAQFDDVSCRQRAGCRPGSFVHLTVSDNGTGMTAEALSHAFEPFFTTKEFGKGTGLGLATVYGIVSQNDGFVNISSREAQGTTIEIFLPRSVEIAAAADALPPAPHPVTAASTILLVEDDPMVRDLTNQLLVTLGHEVIVAASAAHALSLCAQQEIAIDLLMTDVVMPGMNGKELLQRVQMVRPAIRVLFMSGYTSDVIARHGVLDQGIAFIQKPFSIDDLALKIHDALGSP